MKDLVDIGVLVKGVHSAWASFSFFRPKEGGCLHFVLDLRKLIECLERRPYPLSLVEDVIWRMNDFTHATCLDINRGYYHLREIHHISTIFSHLVNVHSLLLDLF